MEWSNAMRAREHVARLGNTWGSRCAAGVLKLRHLLLCITKRRAPHSSGTARIPLSETSFNTTHKRIRSNILTLRIRVAGVWSSAIKSGTTPKMRSAEQLSWHNVRNCGTLKWAGKKKQKMMAEIIKSMLTRNMGWLRPFNFCVIEYGKSYNLAIVRIPR